MRQSHLLTLKSYRVHEKNFMLAFCCLARTKKVLQDWFRANKLTLNVEKSVCLIFNNSMCKNVNMSLTLSGKTIPIEKETKFLGVWLDKDVKWE